MTWNEFKAHIDKRMEEEGVPEEAEIEWIDISYPCLDHDMCRPEVYYGSDDNSLAIY